ncbi:unnamed protein product [Mytilus coruscus]|uniref:Tick transposon n=1 Tax=Mytilus coruscus TaxID=42192 RepID=A0A6J8ATI5_MYTCO|nr:unnamed protein product [Mytilus coruscus]
MAFHPQRCTTIHISKKRKPTICDYHLHSHTLESVPGGKYFGLYISKDLSWREHINQTTAKASRSVEFLRRNLRSGPQEIKSHVVEVPVHHLFNHHNTKTRGFVSNNIRQIRAKLDCFKYSFIPATIISWNNIPPDIRATPSVEHFRHAIQDVSVSTLLHI